MQGDGGQAIHDLLLLWGMMDWRVLLSTFGLLFVAELGDKTQLAVISQTCKSHRPWEVFAGASLALTAVTAIGAAGGEALGRVLPDKWLDAAASTAFVIVGLFLARQAWMALDSAERKCAPDEALESEPRAPTRVWSWQAFASTFGLLFVAELGDKTELAVLSVAGERQAAWPVFAGAALALTTVTALGVVGGQSLCRLIPERALTRLSAVAFVAIGLLMGFGIL
jgi:putative Ca2+/H+ antiporter (TMEM165/GDT1 family)